MSFTNMTVTQVGSYEVSSRRWLRGPHGTENGMMPSIPLDLATFTGANFANGIVKDGCVLGQITASKKYGPYDPAATDGRQTAVGFLWNTGTFPADRTQLASDALYRHGAVVTAFLPYQSGIGALDAAARTALSPRVFLD